MLYEKLQVFEEMLSFSLHGMLGKILPGVAGLVGCCYRLAPGYPMVDYYNTRVPMPGVRDLADLGLYSGVSLVKDRKVGLTKILDNLGSYIAMPYLTSCGIVVQW